MSPKAPLFAFAASLAVHTLAVTSFGLPWGRPSGGLPDDAIEIAYVQAVADPAPVVVAQERAPRPKAADAAKKEAPRALSKALKPAPLKPSPGTASAAVIARRKGMKPWYPPEDPAPKGGADFLSDPSKARVFVNYFALIKRRINETAKTRYAEEALGGGSVSLVFVLNSDGTLASVSVAPQQTAASADVRAFAVRCVREAAPFIGFPAELDVKRISFNITVFFDSV